MSDRTHTPWESLFTFGLSRPFLAIALVVLLTGLTSLGLPSLRIDVSYDTLINPLDSENRRYEETARVFQSDYITLIYLQADDLFTTARLRELETLTRALEKLDGVEDVQGLFTVSNIRNDHGWLDVNPVLETTPATETEIAEALVRARNNPFVMGNILSDDLTATAINVIFDPRWDDDAFAIATYEAVESLIESLPDTFGAAFQLGPPRTMIVGKRAIEGDMKVIGSVAVFLLLVTLLVFMRTRSAVLLPILTACISLYWTLGLLGLMGVPLTVMTAALPALIVVVGSTEDTHLLSAYLVGLEKAQGERPVAVAYMARKVGQATFVTAVTTTAGFAVGGLTVIELMRHSAIALALGMAVNFAVTVLILPLVLGYAGPKRVKTRLPRLSPHRLVNRIAETAIVISSRWGNTLVAAAIAATLACLSVVVFLRPTNDPISLLHARHPVVRDIENLHERLAGLQLFYIVVEGEGPDSFLRPDALGRLVAIQDVVNRSEHFDLSLSLADHVAFINREMHDGRREMYRVPDNADLIAQYLLLFSRNDLRSFVTPDFSRANILVRHGIFRSATFNDRIGEILPNIVAAAGPDFHVFITSKGILINRGAETLIYGLLLSFAALVAVVGGMIAITYRSLRLGLISLVPNILPASATYLAMALLDIPLSPGTALAAVVALGIAVDDTIHLINAFRQALVDRGDREAAISTAVMAQAMPVCATTFALTACFGSLALSEFAAVGDFGLLCAIAIPLALVSDLLLTPALLRRFSPTDTMKMPPQRQ